MKEEKGEKVKREGINKNIKNIGTRKEKGR